jgi:hypothetical protein
LAFLTTKHKQGDEVDAVRYIGEASAIRPDIADVINQQRARPSRAGSGLEGKSASQMRI